MDTNSFTQKSMEALQAAQQLAQSYGNAQVEQVHLLDALLSQENGLIGQLMGKLGLNVQQVRTACESAVNRLPKIGWIPHAGCAGSPAGQSDRQNDRQGDNNCKKPACDNQPFPVVRLAQKHPYRAF